MDDKPSLAARMAAGFGKLFQIMKHPLGVFAFMIDCYYTRGGA
jgi:hypothetical protein